MDARTPIPATTARPIVALSDVSKRFANGTLALSGMSMKVQEGQFISLLGPSGCGKSTALRLVAGLGVPTSGQIDWPRSAYTVDGRPQRETSFVFQEPTLMPWATVFDNVWLPLRLGGQSKAQSKDKIMDALAMVGLEKFGHAYGRSSS